MKPRLLCILPVSVAAAALIWSLPFPQASRQEISFAYGCAEAGQALRHGLPFDTVSYRMPGSSLLAAWLTWSNPFGWEVYAWFCDLAQSILLAGLAYQLRGAWGAAAALLLFGLFRPQSAIQGDYPQRVVCLLALTAAGLLVWSARRPGARRLLALAAACGASLIFRSTLVFFSPLLAAAAFRELPSSKSLRRGLLALLIIPFLFLLPWISLNARVHGRFVPLEFGQADLNVVTGALGLVQTVEGNITALLPQGMDPSSSKLLWAAREALGHPRRALRAFLLRLKFVVLLNPVLFLLAAAGLWLGRGRPFRWLALLAGSHLFIHCLMSIQENYVLPLWPLLAALGAGLIPERSSPSWKPDLGSWPALAALGLALGGAGLTMGTCLAYPSRAAAPDAWSQAAARSPEDPWILFQIGSRLMEKGQVREALALLRKAAQKRPDLPKHRLYLAWAQAQLGQPLPLMAWRQEQDSGLEASRELELTARIWRAAVLRPHLPRQARAELKAALEAPGSNVLVRGTHGPAEKEVQGRLKTAEPSWLFGRLDTALASLPPEKRLPLLEDLSALAEAPLKDQLLRQATLLNLRAERHKRRLDLLERAADFPLNPEERLRLAQAFQEAGRVAAAQKTLSPLLKSRPSASVWLEQAALYLLAGQAEQARGALARAASQAFGPGPEDFHRIALAFQAAGEIRHAVSLLEMLTRLRPRQAAYWSDLGLCRHLAGDWRGAAADLKTALRLEPWYWPASLTLGAVYSARGQESLAQKVYEEAMSQPPSAYPPQAWDLLRKSRAPQPK